MTAEIHNLIQAGRTERITLDYSFGDKRSSIWIDTKTGDWVGICIDEKDPARSFVQQRMRMTLAEAVRTAKGWLAPRSEGSL